MCNRYGHWATLTALRARMAQMQLEFFTDTEMGNLPEQKNIYPDQDGPILTKSDAGMTLRKARWGLPPFSEKDRKGRRNTPRNNIRKLSHWMNAPLDDMIAPLTRHDIIVKAEHRCLVPFSAFAEPVRDSTWFEVVNEEVAFFAGVCMEWSGERLTDQGEGKRRKREPGDWLLYAFLTTEANDVVAPIHPDAMPVILTDPDEIKEWLAGGEDSLRLQRPLSNDLLRLKTS